MIAEALRVLLFGMLGIFLVMAIIYGVIVALSKLSAWLAQRNPVSEELIEDEPVLEETEEYDAYSTAGDEYLLEEDSYLVGDDGYLIADEVWEGEVV